MGFFSEVFRENIVSSSNSLGIGKRCKLPHWGLGPVEQLTMYSLTLFGLKCKLLSLMGNQKLCGFPKDKISNRRKVLIWGEWSSRLRRCD